MAKSNFNIYVFLRSCQHSSTFTLKRTLSVTLSRLTGKTQADFPGSEYLGDKNHFLMLELVLYIYHTEI